MKLQRFEFRTLGCLLLPFLVFLLPRSATGQISTQSNTRTGIVFYADPRVDESIWPALFDAFRRELTEEEHEYPLPQDAQLIRASSLAPGQEFARVIEVRLIGRCDVVQQAYRPMPRGPLGWVLRVSGEIQPFVYVDCARVAQFLNPMTLGMNDQQRRNAMMQAISRIALHEWIHIDLQSAGHESHGIRRAELSPDDLTIDSGVSGGR
ncbi:MAG TPA: hypothetical protein VHT28_00670 [Silvibacterium sp.]|nr:hypothetical protein [Silvibacterium sp.]